MKPARRKITESAVVANWNRPSLSLFGYDLLTLAANSMLTPWRGVPASSITEPRTGFVRPWPNIGKRTQTSGNRITRPLMSMSTPYRKMNRVKLWVCGHGQKFRRRQSAPRKSRHVDRSLKVICLVDSNSDGCVACSMRSKVQVRRALLNAVHIVPELFAVVNRCDMIPGAQWME